MNKKIFFFQLFYTFLCMTQSCRLTLLHFGLPTLEEVEGIWGFGVHMFHNRENIQDVLLCEGRLVAAIKVILLYQNLEDKK